MISIIFSCALLAPVPRLAPAETTLSVFPATKTLQVGDPIFAAVQLQAGRDKEVVTKQPFDFLFAALFFEVRGPNESDFRQVMACGQGRASGDGQTKLKSGAAAKTYGLLEASDERKVVHAEGMWEVRCRVECEAETFLSKSVKIEVVARSEKGNRALSEYNETHRRILLGQITTPQDEIDALSKFPDLLRGSYSGLVVDRSLHLLRLKISQDAKSRKAALQPLQKLGNELGDVDKAYLKLFVAGILIEQQCVAEAETILADVSDRSDLEETVHIRLRKLKDKLKK